RRRRDPSRRDHRGEDLALGALRHLAVVLSLRPGGIRRHRLALGGVARRQGRRGGLQGRTPLRARARLAQRARRVAIRARLRRAPGHEKARMTRVTEVAAAVIERPPTEGPGGRPEFLLAKRPEGKPYPGYWEFPGGKIEEGEDARAALGRELHEELGIVVREATPWITRMYTYTHATVRLHFFRVSAWDGEPQPLEDQAIAWQRVGGPDVSPMLPANAPVLAALALPPVMVVSNAAEEGLDDWVLALSSAAMKEPLLVQIREKGWERMRVQ